MPILERDPWRQQYFRDLRCPEHVVISAEDLDSWRLYPAHRWVYNKLLVCETQGMPCAPHGIEPDSYPVFSKPIVNLRGMGAGSRALRSRADYQQHQQPGHFWMPLLEGEHLSSDVAVVDGVPKWWRHTRGEPLQDGMFDWWVVLAEPRPALEAEAGAWLCANLRGYTGVVNLETIGGKIIEAHLRFTDQWPDLYGAGWLDALVALYARGQWSYADHARRTGYSVVLWGPHGRAYGAPAAALVAEVARHPLVSSLQITFDPGLPPAQHAMPPGGFRLAIVNAWSLEAGQAARAALAPAFGV